MQPSSRSSSQFNAAVTNLEGMYSCKQKLCQYQTEWNNERPADNDISYWRNFVAKYYAPDSKRRFCMSALKDQAIMSMQRTKEKWHCSICKEFSDKCRIEYSFEEMAENFQSKFEMGMEESLNLGPCKIGNSPSNQIVILYNNMNLLSNGRPTSRRSTGELLVVLNAELKILHWNCCMRDSEEFIRRPRPLLQLANTKESQGGINEPGKDPQFKERMKMINDSQVRQETMHWQGSIAQTEPALDVGSGLGNNSNSDMLMPLVRQCFGSMNSLQNSNNFTGIRLESQNKWVPNSDMAVCENSNRCKTLKRSLPDNGLEMDPHPGQQANYTQQRMEVNTSNNNSNNTAPSNLEEEEDQHQRFENIMDDILKAESKKELYALIDSFFK